MLEYIQSIIDEKGHATGRVLICKGTTFNLFGKIVAVDLAGVVLLESMGHERMIPWSSIQMFTPQKESTG